MLQSDLVDIMQDRLEWCVETERYEMAAKLRDLIIYETTDDEKFKQQYYLKLVKKYSPEFYKVLSKKYSQQNELKELKTKIHQIIEL